MSVSSHRNRIGIAAALGAAALVAFAPAPDAATSTPAARLTLAWSAGSARNGSVASVESGQVVRLRVSARSPSARPVTIAASGVPRGASLVRRSGRVATAVLSWRPGPAQAGSYAVTFTAEAAGIPFVAASPRTVFVEVRPRTPTGADAPAPLTGPHGLSRWARVLRPVVARRFPSRQAPPVTRVSNFTPEGTRNLVLALERQAVGADEWVRVRLAVLPNNTAGWVPREALGPFQSVRTHLIVHRRLMVATLYRGGRQIFQARVGVGRSYLPTPAGRFYVRMKLTGFSDPMYGPLAFGTSGRAPHLTGWPGGGYIGIHGTNKPSLLPGAVSHGCIRLRNADILRLARLMPVGTPVTVV